MFAVGVETPVGLAIQHVTITDGAAGAGNGGNILVNANGLLMLLYTHVTGGSALQGGGIALIGGGDASIGRSLIDNNVAASVAGAGTGQGGGIASLGLGQANGDALTLVDSTVTGNRAPIGAGIFVTGNQANATTLTRSTVAFNASSGAAGGGIYMAEAEGFTAAGSIVSNNTGVTNPTTGQTGPSNCGGAAKPASNGSNVESLTDCNFTTTADRRNVDPQLGALANLGGDTAVLPIGRTSPALDLIPIGSTPCTGNVFDQRAVARPIGAGCDAGAYEADFVPPPTSIDSGPSGTTTDTSASFTFSSAEPGVTFQCKLDGPQGAGAFGGCVSPSELRRAAAGGLHLHRARHGCGGQHVDDARARSRVAAVQQATPTPTATPVPTPVVNKSVVIQPVSGKVTVKLPGQEDVRARRRHARDPGWLDGRHDARARSACSRSRRPGKPAENALFYDGIFQVKLGGGITELRLTEQLAKCPSGKASAAAAKKKPKTRKLWGDGSGSFRTRGQYSAATVRGTKWLVQDSCGKTLTRVAKGVVSVNDFVRHKTILLRAPHRYTARKKH